MSRTNIGMTVPLGRVLAQIAHEHPAANLQVFHPPFGGRAVFKSFVDHDFLHPPSGRVDRGSGRGGCPCVGFGFAARTLPGNSKARFRPSLWRVVQFLSRFAAGGTPAGQRGQRSWHGDTSTQRKQVGFDGMTQTHLLALRACIFGSSERKHASQRCPYQLHDLRSWAGG